MAPKKAPAGDNEAFAEFERRYQKAAREYDGPKMDSDIWTDPETGEVNAAWNFKREFDPMAFRILFKTLIGAKYGQIQAIRVWNCKGSDESVRSVCEYLMLPEAECKDLQFTDNKITPLGCEFIGKTLGPIGSKTVNLLKLDYNKFGYEGVAALSSGLSQNTILRDLSLQYCNITEEGGQYIAHILMFKGSVLEKLNLRGNYLKEQGLIDVCNGARRCAKLEFLDVYDNKFKDTDPVLAALRDLMVNNTKLKHYDLGGNMISDAGAGYLVQEIVKENVSHLTKVLITERTQETTSAALLATYAGKKGGKKKK